MRKNFILGIFLILFVSLLFLSNSARVQAAELVYDDFNDCILGSNLGGIAGAMSPDGKYDPQIAFISNPPPEPPESPIHPEPPEPPLRPFPPFPIILSVRSHGVTQGVTNPLIKEGAAALKITYNFPNGKWCGYWSFTNNSQTGSYDVSGYTDVRLWVKGAVGGEKFKLELKDTLGHLKAVDITELGEFSGGLTGEYKEVIFPLSFFTGVDMRKLNQVNIIFDKAPNSGTIYVDYIRFTTGTSVNPGLPIFDDFNDGVLGPNLGGLAGFMGSTGMSETHEFNSPNTYEGNCALKFSLTVPAGGWAGYFDQWTVARDVSSYTDIRMWVKGKQGGEKFKIELSDSDFDASNVATYAHSHSVDTTVLPDFGDGITTAYQELVVPLSLFAGVDFNKLKQVNLIFDGAGESNIYLDKIYFSTLTPVSSVFEGLVVDLFNDGVLTNDLGGSSGIMNGDATTAITAQFDVLNKYEGLAGMKLTYDRALSWAGYWTFMNPTGDGDTVGRDVSAYKDLKIWVKGAAGGEGFKIELKDASNNKAQSQVLTAGTVFEEKVLSLSNFSGIDLAHLKQISLVFDAAPNSGTVYIDCIRFTGAGASENQVPQALIDYITPTSEVQGKDIAFSGHGTDSDGTIATYNWRSSIDGQLSTQASFAKSNLSVGTHTIYFKVQDDHGDWSGEVSQILTINAVSANKSPIAKIKASPRSGNGPLTVKFYSSGSYDPDGSIVSYRWDFGDGKTSTLANPRHVYAKSTRTKYYYTQLTVTDDDGATKKSSRLKITVYPYRLYSSWYSRRNLD